MKSIFLIEIMNVLTLHVVLAVLSTVILMVVFDKVIVVLDVVLLSCNGSNGNFLVEVLAVAFGAVITYME